MFNHSAFVLLLSIGLILLSCSYSFSAASSRKGNPNGNIFNLLLGLYKINPLKRSPVFQSFSNNLLGLGKKDHVVLNFESGESVKVNEQVKMNLNEIEKVIHKRNKKPAKHYEKPAYDLDDVGTEIFKADLVIDDKNVLSQEELQSTLDNHNIMEDFSPLFEHIASKQNDIEMPVTKLLPVNETIIRYSQMSNQNEAAFGLKHTKSKSVNHIGMLAKARDRNPEVFLMDNLAGLGDVIVL